MSVWEGGVRTPAAVWWPGVIEGGRKVETPIVNVDLMPTLVKACGGKAEGERPLDGVDVMDVLTGKGAGEAVKSRDLYFFTGQTGLENEQLAITSGDGWKLVVVGPDVRRAEGISSAKHKVQLFHLSEDLEEKTDLAAREPERVKAMGAKLVEFRKSEPKRSLPPINRKPARFEPPVNWHNGPAEGKK